MLGFASAMAPDATRRRTGDLARGGGSGSSGNRIPSAPESVGVEEKDLIIIGSGPAGYVAAIRAAQLGRSVLIVEKDPQPGGTCLHRGCIPTKALLHSAGLFAEIGRAERFGIRVGEATFDVETARRYRDGVVAKNARGIEYLFRKHRIESVQGWGRLGAADEVEVERDGESRRYRARNVLLATGSVPGELPSVPVDGERVLNSDQILTLDRVPESLVVLGGGAVGCEFASIYASLGCAVSLVELLPRLLPLEDEEVSAELARVFSRRGIRVYTATRLSGLEQREGGLQLTLATEQGEVEIKSELLLSAVGRKAVVDGIGLKSCGLAVEEGFVPVNEWMQTGVPSIYAVGDLVRTAALAHVGSAEGVLAVEHMSGVPTLPLDYDRVPWCTYCEPEVASVGLSETEARERGYDVMTGKFPFSALGKAAILGKTEGFVKVVAERKYDELLGVHIIGAHATDLIAESCIALEVESTTEELFRTMHAHPTLSEAMAEAGLAAAGRAVHI